MKKNLLFLAACLTCIHAVLSSCNSSDEEITEPKSSFYFMEPTLQWGASSAEVMSFMDGYSLLSSSPNALIFEGRDSEDSYLYAFSGPAGALSYAVLTFDLREKSHVEEYLEAHYSLKSSEDGHPVYTDKANTTAIYMTCDNSVYLTYMGRTSFCN